MKYSVETCEVTEYGVTDCITIAMNLSLRAAIKVAKAEAGENKRVYIAWYRPSDGQHGYYNPDSNHAISGHSW